MTILIKQTSGLILSIVFIGYKILEIENAKEIKIFLKIFGIRLFGVMISVMFFAIYLTCSNIWTEFIDYAILGVKTFSNSLSYLILFRSDKIIVKILAYAMPIIFCIMTILYITSLIKVNLKEKKYVKNLYLLLVYSVASIIVIFPISDKGHFRNWNNVYFYLWNLYDIYIRLLHIR